MIHEWVLTIILAIAFYGAGGTKLAGTKMQVENFVRWKYPPWLRPVAGAVEVTAATLLLIPSITLYGAGIITTVMIIAVYTHVFREKVPRHAAGPAVLLILAVVLGMLRGAVAQGPAGDVFHALFGG